MKTLSHLRPPDRPVSRSQLAAEAFTLLEVIIAAAIFFMCAFAVLQLISQGLSGARALQQREPDLGILAAAFSLTNRIEEGTDSGDFEEIAPGLYPGYSWTRDKTEVGSNGLFLIDFYIIHQDRKSHTASGTKLSVLKWAGGSPTGGRFGGGSGSGGGKGKIFNN